MKDAKGHGSDPRGGAAHQVGVQEATQPTHQWVRSTRPDAHSLVPISDLNAGRRGRVWFGNAIARVTKWNTATGPGPMPFRASVQHGIDTSHLSNPYQAGHASLPDAKKWVASAISKTPYRAK